MRKVALVYYLNGWWGDGGVGGAAASKQLVAYPATVQQWQLEERCLVDVASKLIELVVNLWQCFHWEFCECARSSNNEIHSRGSCS